jgi:hypothetical protein
MQVQYAIDRQRHRLVELVTKLLCHGRKMRLLRKISQYTC